jgi:hypothetical protein
MSRLLFEMASGMDTRMGGLGLSLEMFHKGPEFIRNSLSSLQFILPELSRRYNECQHDVELLKLYMNAVARAPSAGGADLLRSFSPESIERMRQLLNEGPGGIEARMRSLGLNLKLYGEDHTFLKRALGSLQYSFFSADRHLAQSIAAGLDHGTFLLMERFMENDTNCYGEESVKRRFCSIPERRMLLEQTVPDRPAFDEVCKWFKLGYPVYSRLAGQYGNMESYSFMMGEFRLTPYFVTMAGVCTNAESKKGTGPEDSLNEESKRQHK